jgi:hypothetical protein
MKSSASTSALTAAAAVPAVAVPVPAALPAVAVPVPAVLPVAVLANAYCGAATVAELVSADARAAVAPVVASASILLKLCCCMLPPTWP